MFPPSARNMFFYSCLLIILAYGALSGWYMLHHFDLLSVIDMYGDDAFYYFQIARNFADGQFSTFDGGITRTNGYHPLWMLFITPLWWIFDSEGALFAVLIFQTMLAAVAVVLIVVAARLAGVYWVLLFGVLPMLYDTSQYQVGQEVSAGLFMLGLLFLALCLFARDPMRWRWLLAVVAFLLPWARVEYLAISVAATAALCFIEWSWRVHGRVAGSGGFMATFTPLLGAVAGGGCYFAWNGIIFGGIVPVSGATKVLFSLAWFESEGGYSFLRNLQEVASSRFFDWELLVALEICIYFLLFWWFGHRSRKREDWLFLAFLIGMFALSAGHVAKFVASVLTMHPYFVEETSWHYVPGYLMMALVVPVRCYVAIYFINRHLDGISPRTSVVLRKGILVFTAWFIFANTNFSSPYQNVEYSKNTRINASESPYAATLLMNRILPEESIIGSWHAGVIGYFSRFPVVNLDGLVNSYDYMNMRHVGLRGKGVYNNMEDPEFYHRLFGVSHFLDLVEVNQFQKSYLENRYFETAMIYIANDPNTDPYASVLWPSMPPGEIDPAVSFWERLKPHFDFETDGVGVVAEGRLVQVFARECETEKGGSLVILFDGEGRISVLNPWENRWAALRGRRPGSCMDTLQLPRNVALPIRLEVLSESDGAVSRLIGDDWRIVVRSDYDVYLHKRQLVYVNEQCNADTSPSFFVEVTPVDGSDLSIWRRLHGIEFEGHGFSFDDFVHRMGNTCIAVRDLPDYEIARIRTGQYVADGPWIWHGEIRFDIGAGWIARVVEHAEPVIRAGGFDVYHDGNRLLYTSGECGDESLASVIFLHIFPEDEDDLPARFRVHGFHNLDFPFKMRLRWAGLGCAAVVDLPGYEIARIRTGQVVHGGSVLWDREFEVLNEAETGHVVENPPA